MQSRAFLMNARLRRAHQHYAAQQQLEQQRYQEQLSAFDRNWRFQRLDRAAAFTRRRGFKAQRRWRFVFKWQLTRPDLRLRHSRHCQSSLARSRALLRCVPDCRSARLGGIEGRSCTQQSGRGVAPAAVRGTWWWHVRMACCRRMAHAVVQNAANKTAEHGNTERRTEIREIRHGHGHGQKKMRVFRSVFDSRKNTEKNVFNSPASAFAVT